MKIEIRVNDLLKATIEAESIGSQKVRVELKPSFFGLGGFPITLSEKTSDRAKWIDLIKKQVKTACEEHYRFLRESTTRR